MIYNLPDQDCYSIVISGHRMVIVLTEEKRYTKHGEKQLFLFSRNLIQEMCQLNRPIFRYYSYNDFKFGRCSPLLF